MVEISPLAVSITVFCIVPLFFFEGCDVLVVAFVTLALFAAIKFADLLIEFPHLVRFMLACYYFPRFLDMVVRALQTIASFM
jgi:hypothetical protein